MPELKHYVAIQLYDNQFMKKLKKLCYKCNTFRYLRGFKGKGKRRNNVCNLCLKKNIRTLYYMSNEDLERANKPQIFQTPQRKNPDNLEYTESGYWFEED